MSSAHTFPPNHLIHEKSPYLQQHAANPVDWYPWGDEAFRRAADEDKPVFLSIGYATCHWCHVMAHESFEDEGIAGLLNTSYIAIKVDREERPDIDSVYMTACQQMTGQGGWPLTIIMTPDRKPFFAGTYLPRSSRAGMTGLDDLLRNVTRLWQEQRERLTGAAEQLTGHLEALQEGRAPGTADSSLLHAGYGELAASFDPKNGGFGRAPKFPTPATILFLLRYGKRTDSSRALFMAETTLEAMCRGGIHDHLGGGFHRYSTDAAWLVPHFEKMLYDQALLLMAFSEAWQATKKPLYRKTAESIITYVTRDLLSPEGAFISAEDADSPGGEGAFYLWTARELEEILGRDEGGFAARLYGARDEGNFPSPEAGVGKNILVLRNGTPGDGPEPARMDAIRTALLAAREKRPRPQKDKKILTDWNALMIAALAGASRAFDRPDYHRAAETAMRFILARLRSGNGGLLHRYCDGEAAIPAFTEDYAFMIHALIELYETDFDPAWLEEAVRLHRRLRQHFSDPGAPGFFTVSDEENTLILRKKEIYDGAVPSGNSVMLINLVRLGHLTGESRYEEEASYLADAFAGTIRLSPSAYCAFLSGLDHLFGPATDVVIAGEETDPDARAMVRATRDLYLPSVTVHFRSDGNANALGTAAPYARSMTMKDGKATAYVCSGRSCSAPVTSIEALQKILEKN